MQISFLIYYFYIFLSIHYTNFIKLYIKIIYNVNLTLTQFKNLDIII